MVQPSFIHYAYDYSLVLLLRSLFSILEYMHIYFSGIGGAGIAPLALIARQAGYTVSGSDKQNTQYIDYLRSRGINDIHIDQSREAIEKVHERDPIDWFVYTSALPLENPDAPELRYCSEQDIKMSKRDELLNQILDDKKLKLIAVAGTHGKTTTTAMVIWLFKQLDESIGYLLPAKTSFAEMGEYSEVSEYFVYEADEFDRNFLAYKPETSLITGVSWDHHEIFPTREDYQDAFREFINQSKKVVLWQDDAEYLGINKEVADATLDVQNPLISNLDKISLKGFYNRLDAWLAMQVVHSISAQPIDALLPLINAFPGLQRRMEMLIPDLYTDYAHTPEKIRGAMSVACEMATEKNQSVIVIYEPLTNRRQHFMLDEYRDCFDGATKVYWIPSYLAREDPGQRIIPPGELISHLSDPSIAVPAERNADLKKLIQKHIDSGDMVVGIAGGGGDSLDEWLRHEFKS
jgi:UDP-N-acetylmuramate--alanine ligase